MRLNLWPDLRRLLFRKRRGGRAGLRRSLRDTRGNSTIEFALALPVLVTLGMYGTEIAHMSTVNMEVSQIAMSVADNASRLGQTDNSSVTPTVNENGIDAVMEGALEQASSIDLETNGRIILSSLEKDSYSARQYIHWQRCRGALKRDSNYGKAGTGKYGERLDGMGQPGRMITAGDGSAVMYAEVYYEYQPLFGDMFVGPVVFQQEAAFQIRDDRNLSPGVTGSGGKSACA